MISLLNQNALPSFKTNWQSTYIRSRFLAYGGDAAFAPFFTDERGNVLSVLNRHAVFYAERFDAKEWALFLSMHPDIDAVCTSMAVANALEKELHCTIKEKRIMHLKAPLPPPSETVTEQMPRQVYPLLKEVFGDTMPAFDEWYVDISHRIRHQNCTVAGIIREGVTVSTAMTVAESENAVVIGAVATAESARKQGFAAQCIQYLTAKNKRKTIMISPKNVYAQRLYTSMGFEVFDIIGELTIKKEE